MESERTAGGRKEAGVESPVLSGADKTDGGGSANDAERRILKTVINDYWKRGKKIGKKKDEEKKRSDADDKGQVSSTPKESKGWWRRRKRGGEKKLGRQGSRFEKSMRVLEWLDADCGTRLAQHYEQAGGWRSLPARRQRQQPLKKAQKQPLRLTKSHLVLGTDSSKESAKTSTAATDTSSSSSSTDDDDDDDEEKKVLEDSEDFLDNVDGIDDDDVVLSIRKRQEGEPQQHDCYEELSMKEYVTSSDGDDDDDENKANGDQSDSEDELVLALKAWKDEQQRQERLLQQQQLHRQHSLAQQPPPLTPVLEDQVSSPTHESFAYFYQDQGSVFYQYGNQRQKNSQTSGVTPYWWGGISSVREGPSSPPIIVTQSDIIRGSHYLVSPHLEASLRNGNHSNDYIPTVFPDPATSFKHSIVVHGSVPSLASATTLAPISSQSSVSHHSGFLPPPKSPLLSSSQVPSPRYDTSNWNFHRGFKPPLSPTSADTGPSDTKGFGGKLSDIVSKGDLVAAPPRTPLSGKPSSSGFSVFSNWLGSTSGDKQTGPLSSYGDVPHDTRHGEAAIDSDSQHHHQVVCVSLSTTSSDSGIEKSPGYLSPAPRSAGIEKIGDFFRRFQHKLSASSSPPSATKTTAPLSPGKHLYKKQQKTGTTRRLSLSTSSIPSSSLLKASSPLPVVKLTAAHARCSATKSDPLAAGAAFKRPQTSWSGGQQSKNNADPESPALTAASPHLGGHSSGRNDKLQGKVVSSSSSSGGGGGGGDTSGKLSRLTTPGGPVDRGVTHSDRKVESNVHTLNTLDGVESRSVSPLTTSAGVSRAGTAFGKDSELSSTVQSSSNFHYLQQHQPLCAKRSTGDVSKQTYGQDNSDASTSGIATKSASRYFSRDNLDALKKSNEALDSVGDHCVSSGTSVGVCETAGSSKLTKVASHIFRKSPISDSECTAQSDSVGDWQDTDKPIVSGGATVGAVCGSTSVSGGTVNVGSGKAGVGVGDSVVVTSVQEVKGKQTEEFMRSEVSSLSCEDKGALSVPHGSQDRGRRGSHGTCNFLFLDQQHSGRKSPNPPKGRKSPSPIRGTLFKTAINSTSTSSSSSTESSSKFHHHHHHVVSRVQSLPSPSSPPPHQQQTPKTSPKHVPNVASSGSESPTKKMTSESPPPGYQGRRKFSDTGLTPLPRRLFNEGRRGSLTDERTLVSAKSKLGKLRNQGRKSSDAGSIAALVKQIHNLWGEKDDELDDIHERRESVAGISGSFDDQVLFDKRRKRFSLSIGRHKDGAKDESSDNSPLQSRFTGSISNILGDKKGKQKTAEKATHQPVTSTNSSASSSPAHKAIPATEGDSGYSVKESNQLEEPARVSETIREDKPNTSTPAGAVITPGPTSSAIGEFVAPVAQVAGRQLVATAVSSAACFVGHDPDQLINRGPIGASLANISTLGSPSSGGSGTTRYVKKTTVQFQPIVSWDDNVVGGKIHPALRSVLKQGARRHSSFAGFSESSDNLSLSDHEASETITIALNKQAINGLPKSKTSDNYKGILKQTDRTALSNTELDSSSTEEKRRAKSPCAKSRKNEDIYDHSPDPKSESSLSLCLKATRSVSPKSKKSRGDAKEVNDQSTQGASEPEAAGDSVLCHPDHHTKTVGIQATPQHTGKTSNTGTQTSDLYDLGESTIDHPDALTDGAGWLQRLAAKCMASVGGTTRPGTFSGVSGGLPRAASVRAEWLLGNKRMGSGPSSPVSASSSDPSERFWVPHEVIARKRAQSLVPTLSKSEDDLSSEAVTPASASHTRDLAFIFPVEKSGAAGLASDGQPSTPPSGYNLSRRRASMHDAIDLNKIDTRLYDKKLVRQASVSSVEEESQGTIHVSMEHNPETNILTVNLIRAHNLLPRDPDGTANPYFRLSLLPGQRTSAQCRIHRKTLNPIFEEEFIFELASEEVATTTLELLLYEYDQFSTDECIGFVRIPLNNLDLCSRVDLWRSIAPYEKPKDQKDVGDVMFSVSYLPSAERLTVVIVRARNLRLTDDGKVDLNPFIKVCITSGNKKLKKKKTSTAHGTNSPTWNEALMFSVPREKLKTVAMEVMAYHDSKLGSDELIGRVRLAPDCEEGIHCQDLLTEKSMPARWYSLG